MADIWYRPFLDTGWWVVVDYQTGGLMMRCNTDIVVRVVRAGEGRYTSPQAEYRESWSYPHFPEIHIFEVKTPLGATCWFGAVLYRDQEIPRKLSMPGVYIALIPGMERLASLEMGQESGLQGFCITLAKDEALKGLGWELLMAASDPWAGPGQGTVKKFEEWKESWRKRIAGVEAELFEKDAYWHTYSPQKRSKGVVDDDNAEA